MAEESDRYVAFQTIAELVSAGDATLESVDVLPVGTEQRYAGVALVEGEGVGAV